MAKPKRPRLGKAPITKTNYMVEFINRTTEMESVTYQHTEGRAQASAAANVSSARLIRIFRVEYKLVKEIKK